MKKGEQLKLLLKHWHLDMGNVPLDPAKLPPVITTDEAILDFLKDVMTLHKHGHSSHVCFYYLSQFVKPGVTKPAGRFGGISLDDALEFATRYLATLEGDKNNSKPFVLRLDFVENKP